VSSRPKEWKKKLQSFRGFDKEFTLHFYNISLVKKISQVCPDLRVEEIDFKNLWLGDSKMAARGRKQKATLL
jgi:hypothetical protein